MRGAQIAACPLIYPLAVLTLPDSGVRTFLVDHGGPVVLGMSVLFAALTAWLDMPRRWVDAPGVMSLLSPFGTPLRYLLRICRRRRRGGGDGTEPKFKRC